MSIDRHDSDPTDRLMTSALRARNARTADACVDAEVLAAWVEGSLEADRAAAVEDHIADCARCRALVATFAAAETAGEAASVVPFQPRAARPRRWLVPAAIGTVAASLMAYALWPRPAASIDTPLDTLASQAAPQQTPPAPMPELAAPVPSPGSRVTSEDAAKAAKQAGPDRQQARNQALSKTGVPGPPLPPPPSPAFVPPPPVATGATPVVATPTATALPPPPASPPVRTDASAAAARISDVVQTLPRADRGLQYVSMSEGILEFGPPASALTAAPTGSLVVGGVGRAAGAGGAGRGGRGGGGGNPPVAMRAEEAPKTPAPPSFRWRVLATGRVERTINGGTTWTAVSLDASAFITFGSAPSIDVCWLVGRDGVILISLDGVKFNRLPAPEPVTYRSIVATDARVATVTTDDGRTFTTTDGGQTWRRD